jgi:hypothetical protein
LANAHVRLRDSLRLLTRPADQEVAAAEAERAAWLAELRRVGLLAEHADIDEIVLALHHYLLEQVLNDPRTTALAETMHAQTAPSAPATC